jgi:hypothetical protein
MGPWPLFQFLNRKDSLDGGSDPSFRASEDNSYRRPPGHCDRRVVDIATLNNQRTIYPFMTGLNYEIFGARFRHNETTFVCLVRLYTAFLFSYLLELSWWNICKHWRSHFRRWTLECMISRVHLCNQSRQFWARLLCFVRSWEPFSENVWHRLNKGVTFSRFWADSCPGFSFSFTVSFHSRDAQVDDWRINWYTIAYFPRCVTVHSSRISHRHCSQIQDMSVMQHCV